MEFDNQLWVGRKRQTLVCYVVDVLKRIVAVVAMACLSPSRICARVQDKLLCHFGHKVQVRRQTVFVKLKPPGPSPLRIFGKTCQVRNLFTFSLSIIVNICLKFTPEVFSISQYLRHHFEKSTLCHSFISRTFYIISVTLTSVSWWVYYLWKEVRILPSTSFIQKV